MRLFAHSHGADMLDIERVDGERVAPV